MTLSLSDRVLITLTGTPEVSDIDLFFYEIPEILFGFEIAVAEAAHYLFVCRARAVVHSSDAESGEVRGMGGVEHILEHPCRLFFRIKYRQAFR